ncbi:hypothetical protein MTR_1g033430 [Medicago truncatula]|uniref:Uncharacterized protein n=1 Tax=Medicago truncatula TaxID=3880 RepID=A0A072VGX1_MEDTR|nr:hypothetical protein MTR_1g033430 [Medicago truncatula]
MESRGWVDGGGAWEWRRRLLAWEEESVTDFSFLLHDVVLHDRVPDRWQWLLDPVVGYSVMGTYQYITTSVNSLDRGSFVIDFQLEITFFVWELFIRIALLASGGADFLRLWRISYFDVTSSVQCGTMYISG